MLRLARTDVHTELHACSTAAAEAARAVALKEDGNDLPALSEYYTFFCNGNVSCDDGGWTFEEFAGVGHLWPCCDTIRWCVMVWCCDGAMALPLCDGGGVVVDRRRMEMRYAWGCTDGVIPKLAHE